jgi:hypothetical protein
MFARRHLDVVRRCVPSMVIARAEIVTLAGARRTAATPAGYGFLGALVDFDGSRST